MVRSGFRLGRVAGIDVNVDWSWLFIFVLVTWNLAMGVFPQLHPDWPAGLSWTLGVLASLLFFASVLAHELAHSLVARARGLPVRRITLFLFGGVSNIEREPPSPATEFLMAIVGPLTSFVLGAAFLLLAGASVVVTRGIGGISLRFLSNMGPLATMLLWLGPINIILAVFNMIPGFPLDGGRVLRSILWAATHSLRRATRWATAVSHVIAWLFILGGVAMVFGMRLPFFGTGLVSGLWLAFIGWFLNNAASQSYQQVLVQDMLEGVTVSRLMRADAPTIPAGTSVASAVYDYLMNKDEKAFPVLDGECLVGLVCLEDIRKVPREQWDVTRVDQIMTPVDKLAVVAPNEDATEALNQLGKQDVRQVPVVQDCRLVGMLRQRDIMRWLQVQSSTAAS